jgi:Response regulator containing a CheY-like receiver domain and an HTH DNA-binding domain
LILLDIRMPKMSGIEVLRRVRADPALRMIPVVMMTSSDEPCDVEAAYRLGANSYVVKPLEFDDFIHAAEEVGVYWSRLNEVASA